jgi:hypothetical protein
MLKSVEGLRKVFDVKIQYTINNILGCEIIEFPGEPHIYQTRIIQKMLKGADFLKEEEHKIATATGFKIVRPKEEEKLELETQKWFRSTLGLLLYLVKLS